MTRAGRAFADSALDIVDLIRNPVCAWRLQKAWIPDQVRDDNRVATTRGRALFQFAIETVII